jgi:hypothetical protein
MTSTNNDFQVWLDQSVWITNVEKATRREYLPHFAEDLTHFMSACGYTMDSRWREGHMIVARWMYMIHVQEFVTRKYDAMICYGGIHHRDWNEDFHEYAKIMDFDKISSFMERWKFYEDLDPETRVGQRVLHDLQNLLYHFIDMDNSKIGIMVATAEDSDSDSEDVYRRTKDDVYLMEAREGMHGGYGSKV